MVSYNDVLPVIYCRKEFYMIFDVYCVLWGGKRGVCDCEKKIECMKCSGDRE
mgnify:FL=1